MREKRAPHACWTRNNPRLFAHPWMVEELVREFGEAVVVQEFVVDEDHAFDTI